MCNNSSLEQIMSQQGIYNPSIVLQQINWEEEAHTPCHPLFRESHVLCGVN